MDCLIPCCGYSRTSGDAGATRDVGGRFSINDCDEECEKEGFSFDLTSRFGSSSIDCKLEIDWLLLLRLTVA